MRAHVRKGDVERENVPETAMGFIAQSKKEEVQVPATPRQLQVGSPDMAGTSADVGSRSAGVSPRFESYNCRACCGASPDGFLRDDAKQCSKCSMDPPVCPTYELPPSYSTMYLPPV